MKRPIITHHSVDSRRLVTFAADAPVWRARPWILNDVDVEGIQGSIFRVQPPADASDDDVQQLVSWLLREKAAAVKVEPRANGGDVRAGTQTSHEPPPAPRIVVQQMIDQARSRDRAALQVFCCTIMDEASL